MRKPKDILKKKEFVFFLFWLGAGAFNWPLLSVIEKKGLLMTFLYLFIVWGGMIVVLCAIAAAGDDAG